MKQVQKIAVLFFLLGMVACGRTYASNSSTKPHPAEIGIHQSIPLKIYHDFLVVAEGQFGAVQGAQNFVLDTGTAPSIINSKLVRDLGLTTRAATMQVIGKAASSQTTILPELDLGPIRAVSLPVHVQDLSPLERELGIPVAGILGLDVLSKSNFRLDYEKKRLDFGGTPEDGIRAPFDARTGIAVIAVKVEGRTARMLVDTGTDRVALLGGNFKGTRWLVLQSTTQKGSSLVDHEMGVEVFFSPDIVVGEEHFTPQKAYFVPGSTDAAFDGLLGVRALGFHAIAYNQARGAIYLQK